MDSEIGVFANVDLEEEKEEKAERVRKRGCSVGMEEVVDWSKTEKLAHPFNLRSAYDDNKGNAQLG